MISIHCPEGDYSSSDLAIRLQALAQSQGKSSIYVVPKHLGRNPDTVYSRLNKSSTALLLMHDKDRLDENTEQELEFLLSKKKKIHAIIPDGAALPPEMESKINIFHYGANARQDFASIVQDTVKRLQPGPGKKEKEPNDFAILLTMLAVVILLIGLSSENGGKKVPVHPAD